MKKIFGMLLCAFVMIAMCASCSSNRGAQSSTGKYTAQTGKAGQYAQYGDWKTLVCSGKVNISLGGKSISSSMQMKMVKGQSISISLRPLLGIEVGKVYISGNEILIVDRINKRYVKEEASLLTSGVPVDVSTLQDVLLGRPHIVGKGTFSAALADEVTLEQTNGTVYLTPNSQYQGFTYRYAFDSDKNILSLDVTPAGGESMYSVHYTDVQTSVAGKVATGINVDTKIKNRDLGLDLTLKSLAWNTDFTDSMEVPSGYSQASGSSIISALGGTIR